MIPTGKRALLAVSLVLICIGVLLAMPGALLIELGDWFERRSC